MKVGNLQVLQGRYVHYHTRSLRKSWDLFLRGGVYSKVLGESLFVLRMKKKEEEVVCVAFMRSHNPGVSAMCVSPGRLLVASRT